MKDVKKVMLLLVLISNLFVFDACTDGKQGLGERETVQETNEEETIKEVEFGQYYETEKVTESLSGQCDYILCEGGDEEDYYELVANEEENYQGVEVKVGVIKNNKWLLKPTSKMPLVDEDKTLYGSDIAGLDDAPDSIYYIGFGCFLYRTSTKEYSSTYEEIIYNSNNQKYYEQKGLQDNEVVVSSPRPLDYTTSVHFEEDWEIESKNLIVTTVGSDAVNILNLLTMKNKEIAVQIPKEMTGMHIIHPISEGLFAIAGEYHGCSFYNTTGKLLFTITYEKIPNKYLYEPIIFEDNNCTFTVENNKGSIYNITVNKQGKVVEQIEKD